MEREFDLLPQRDVEPIDYVDEWSWLDALVTDYCEEKENEFK